MKEDGIGMLLCLPHASRKGGLVAYKVRGHAYTPASNVAVAATRSNSHTCGLFPCEWPVTKLSRVIGAWTSAILPP
jgi:hypothetical protein